MGRFDTDHGTKTLAELFDGRSQLLVYHSMFGPSYQAGDPVNSSIADTLDALVSHLHVRDLTVVLVSRAPLATLRAYQQRMGWRFPWVSAATSDFNLDLGAAALALLAQGLASYAQTTCRRSPLAARPGNRAAFGGISFQG